MCFGGSDTSTVTNQTNLPSWYSNAMQGLISRANTVSNNPYPTGALQQVAGLNPLQMNAIQGVSDVQGQWSPIMNAAVGTAASGTQQWPNAPVSAYMNPYAQNVIDIQKQQANFDYDRASQGRDAKAISSGAFGGTRSILEEALAGQGLAGLQNTIQMQGLNQAYGDAQNAWQADQDRALRGAGVLSDLARTGQGLNYADIDSLSKAGSQLQGQAQREYDTSSQNALTTGTWPQEQLNFLSRIINSTPTGIFGSTSTSSQPSSGLAQGLGLATTAASLIGGTGGFGAGGWLTSLLGGMFNKGGPIKKYAHGGGIRAFADGGYVGMSDDEFWRLARTVKPYDPHYSAILEEADRRQKPISRPQRSAPTAGDRAADDAFFERQRSFRSADPNARERIDEFQRGRIPSGIFSGEGLGSYIDREGAEPKFNPPPPVPQVAPRRDVPPVAGPMADNQGRQVDPRRILGDLSQQEAFINGEISPEGQAAIARLRAKQGRPPMVAPPQGQPPIVGRSVANSPLGSVAPEITQAAQQMQLPEMPKAPDVPLVDEVAIAREKEASKFMNSPWQPLTAAGLRLLSSRGENFGHALGGAGQAAVDKMGQQQAAGRQERLYGEQLKQQDYKNKIEKYKAELERIRTVDEGTYRDRMGRAALSRAGDDSLDAYRSAQTDLTRRQTELLGSRDEQRNEQNETRRDQTYTTTFNNALNRYNEQFKANGQDPTEEQLSTMRSRARQDALLMVPNSRTAYEATRAQFMTVNPQAISTFKSKIATETSPEEKRRLMDALDVYAKHPGFAAWLMKND